MNAKETLELISKQWCSLSDLIKLTGLGKNSASKLKSEIRVDLVNKGYQLPTKLLPMNEVVNYLKININYLQKMSKEIEKKYDYRIVGLWMERETLYNRIKCA